MATEHHLIFIPGLGDSRTINKPFQKIAQNVWSRQGFYPHLYLPNWETGQRFAPKLKGIINLIDDLTDQGFAVSLIGQSAGGSAALNAFCQRRDKVIGAINITGRLKAGTNVHPSLNLAARNSPAFKESILLFENKNEPTLKKTHRARIMTIRPMFDEIVPASTVPVVGATNLVAPIIEHSLAGGFISVFYTEKFLVFLQDLLRADLRN